MKSLRVLLVVLLVLVLPLRGAFAGAPHCAAPAALHGIVAAPAAHQAAGGHGGHHARHADHGHHAHQAQEAQQAHAGHHADAPPALAEGGDACAAFCAVAPPLRAAAPSWPAAAVAARAAWPTPAAPAPGFITDGPERPPRRG